MDAAPIWDFVVTARNESAVRIRPLRPDDRQRELTFIASLSDDSRYLRLFSPQKVVPKRLLDQLMDVNHTTRMAFVATIGERDKERLIGIARYGLIDQKDTAELAVTVVDDWHRQGIATLLIKTLCRYAIPYGITRFVGQVLSQNHAMVELCKSLGFAIHRGTDGLTHIELPTSSLAAA